MRTLCVLSLAAFTFAGCVADPGGFSAVERPDAIAPGVNLHDGAMPTEPEATAAILDAIVAFDRPAEYASLMDRVAAATLPSAHADDLTNCTLPPSEPSWITTSLSGPSTNYGHTEDAFVANADTSYCLDSTGNLNDNTAQDLARTFTITGASVTCSWGETYSLSGWGASRYESGKKIYGSFSFFGPSGLEADVACSLLLSDSTEGPTAGTSGQCEGTTTIDPAPASWTCTVAL